MDHEHGHRVKLLAILHTGWQWTHSLLLIDLHDLVFSYAGHTNCEQVFHCGFLTERAGGLFNNIVGYKTDFNSASVLVCWHNIFPHLEPVIRLVHTEYHSGVSAYPRVRNSISKCLSAVTVNLLYKAEKPSVCLSTFFLVMPITWSSWLGSTQDLACVIAVSSGTSKFVFISP